LIGANDDGVRVGAVDVAVASDESLATVDGLTELLFGPLDAHAPIETVATNTPKTSRDRTVRAANDLGAGARSTQGVTGRMVPDRHHERKGDVAKRTTRTDRQIGRVNVC
jgi:hypothetical protein